MPLGDLPIRPGRRADAEPLARAQTRAALVGYRHIFPAEAAKPTPEALLPDWNRFLVDPACAVLVAEVGGAVVGGVALQRSDGETGVVQFEKLYVDPAHWGAGIGSRLHDAAVELARDHGTRALRLWVLAANDRARSLYEKRGWLLEPGRTQILPAGPLEVGYRLDLDDR